MIDGQSGGLRLTTIDRCKKSPSLVRLRDEFRHVARSRKVPGIFL